METAYVYILVSRKDGKCYVGRTNNLLRRFRQHSEGLVVSTRHRRPLVMVHWERLKDKEEATLRERWLKSPESAEFKKRLRSSL